MSSSFIFLFGRTPQLSYLELLSFFPTLQKLGDDGALVEAALDPMDIISKLGGTVKIAKVVGRVSSVTPQSLTGFLTKEKKSNHMVFGVSRYDTASAVGKQFLGTMKTLLAAQGISGRFIEARQEKALSSVVVSRQDVVELIIVRQGNAFVVGRTLAVQPFEEWNRRDYGRPFADPKSGMLPPKVARMVVNIARPSSMGRETPLLLDPFCGMGTILGEALLSGWRVIGSDQSPEVIGKAERNIRWLGSQYPSIDSSLGFFVSDAAHISEKVSEEHVDAIVTEPFMGSTRNTKASRENIKNTIKGLEKLYIGCLKDWRKVLKPGGKVVMALPQYHKGENTYFVKKVIDSCEMLGYTTLAGPIEYSRPQAIVRREFYIFQKK